MRLVGLSDIAKMLGGVSRERARQIAGQGGFPKPHSDPPHPANGRVWKRADVERWIAKNR